MRSNRTQALPHQQQLIHTNPSHEPSQLLILELMSSPFWDNLDTLAQKRWLSQLQDLMR